MQLLSLPLDAVEVYVPVYEVTIRHPALYRSLHSAVNISLLASGSSVIKLR
jgi:hypothetical protein